MRTDTVISISESKSMTMKKPPHIFDAAGWLRQHKLRATPARIGIVHLLDVATTPLTLAEIHDKIRGEGCDFATVFRFITTLEQKGLVDKLPWVDGSTRHEIHSRKGHHHHHYLICRTCQKIEPIDECVVESFEDRVAKERGYSSVSHSLQLSGVCPKCQKTKPKRK